MDHKNITEPPKEDRSDRALTSLKAALQAVPFVGGSATEILSAVVTPSIVRRRDEWVQSIAEALLELEDKYESFQFADLEHNEPFITAVLKATDAAIRTHQKEKLHALRNAVLNVAVDSDASESMQLIFLNIVDVMTSEHLQFLQFIADPTGYAQKTGVTDLSGVKGQAIGGGLFDRTFPELSGHLDLGVSIVQDLYTRGFLHWDEPEAPWFWYDPDRGSGMMASVTPLGSRFLDFIKSPVEGVQAGRLPNETLG